MHKSLSLLALLLIANFSFAQLTPSERRAQKLKEEQQNQKSDEDLSPSERRERKKGEIAKEVVFGDDDPQFKVMEVPAKWGKESAVVIYQKLSYSYLRDNNTVHVDELVRRRIKLLDKAAIADFSEFYYTSHGNDGGRIGIKIIKENGSVVNVNTNAAVETDKDVPDFYRSYYLNNDKYKKLAIPDLQAGDIIDYYFKTQRELSNAMLEDAYDPFLFTLSQTYPIMLQRFEFTVDRGFFINFNSFNGAPALKEGEAGTDLKGRKRAMIKTYELVDKDREKISKDIWNYPLVTSPSVKFQVVYESPNNVKNANYFIGEMGVAKNTITPEEIQSLVGRQLSGVYSTQGPEIIAYIKKNLKNETDPVKIAKEAYYYYRYSFLTSYGYSGLNSNLKETFTLKGSYFVSTLIEVLKSKKIEAQAIVVMPRSLGPLSNLLLSNELEYGVRVAGSKDIIMFPFGKHSNYDIINSELEGTEGYAFTPVRNPRVFNYEKVKIPVSTYQQNNYTSNFELSLGENMESISVKRKNTITGHFKQNASYSALLTHDWEKEERKKFDPKYKEDEPERGNKVRLAEEKRKRDADKEETSKQQKDRLKAELEEEYDVQSFDKFELVESGRFDDKPLVYTEEFKLKNMINKAGRNYIFEIGKIIGKQFELSEKDMKRSNDIFIPYAKSLTNEITVNLPAGYTAEGLQDLNFNIDNPSATFISSAKVEGSKIVIKTQKNYKKATDKKENWPNMVAMLEAAYKFTQKKVILKKI